MAKATKPALKLEPAFRSGLEKKVAEQLEAAGVAFEHEQHKFEYTKPARVSKYCPDFKTGTIFIETKGGFGYSPLNSKFVSNRTGNPAEQRQKYILVKQQHPELDLRFVFERANTKIYKGSPTTYGKWATDNGFLWADKGTIPPEWIKEMKGQQ